MADDTTKEKIIIDVSTNADKATKSISDLSASIEQTTENNRALDKSFDEVYEGMKPLTARMGEAEDRLYELALAGQTATEEYKGLLAVVANYRQTQIETDRVVDAAATTLGQKLGGASQIAATGISGVTAGMALFGDQSEDTEKALLKVQSAMAFADAISSISEMGGQWRVLKSAVLESSVATRANTVATGAAAMVQKLFTGSVDTTSKGFKGLKIAIAGTGIGLLVTGLVALIQNFDKVKQVVLNFVPGLEAVGEQVMSIVNAVTDFVGVTSEADRAMDKMISNADKSLAKNKKFLQEHGSQLDEYSKQKIEIVNEYNEALKEAGANQVALALEANRKLAAVDKARQDEIDKNRAEAAEKEKQRLEKIAAEEDKRRKEAEAKAKEALEKRKKELEEANAINDELQANFAAMEKKRKDDKLIAEDEERKDFLARSIETANQRKNAIEKEIEDDKILAEAKKANQDLLVSQGEQLIKNVQQLAGKNKAIQKAAIIADGGVAVGKAVANTAEAVTKDLAKGAPFSAPLVALDLAVGATSVASIIQGTSKALQAVGGGSAPSAPSLPSTSPGVNAQPQTGFQSSSENQIATSINQANQAPQIIKAFVVGSEVTDQQNLDAKLVGENSFGG